MTSPITQCQTDMLAMLDSVEGIPLDTGTGNFKYTNIWDNQVDEMLTEKQPNYTFGMPAAFVEVDPGECETLGMGVTSYPDCIVKLHLACIVLDSNDGGMERNLTIFQIRDRVKTMFQLWSPRWMSSFQCCEDKLDYKHGNTYKYVLAFRTNLIDTKGSMYDADSGNIVKQPPIALTLGMAYDPNTPVPPARTVLYWKACKIVADLVVTPDPDAVQTLENGDTIPLQYAVNDGSVEGRPAGTLTVSYLTSVPGISVIAPFLINNGRIADMPYSVGTFDNSAHGGFRTGTQIVFNASIPFYV